MTMKSCFLRFILIAIVSAFAESLTKPCIA